MGNQEINNNLNNPSLASESPQGVALQNNRGSTPKSRWVKIGILTTVVFALIFAVSAGAYFLGRNSVLKELNPSNPAIPPKDPDMLKSTPTPDSTADWQTYSNSNFSFKYPPTSKITNEKAYSFMTAQSPSVTKVTNSSSNDMDAFTLEIFTEDNPSKQTPQQFINAYLNKLPNSSSKQDKNTNDFVTKKITDSLSDYTNGQISGLHALFGFDYDYDLIVMTKNNKIYTFLYHGGQGEKISNEAEQKVTQILSTFKFTESSVGDPQILSDATKELGENYALVKINTLYGENYALGSARFESGFGGLEFVAHKENGSWKIIHKGTESPGCSKFTNYPDFPKNLCSPEY